MNAPNPLDTMRASGYLRADGRKGIRNYVVVAYLVECAHHVARTIASKYEPQAVQLIGFPGCYLSDYADSMMQSLCTHPNVGAVLLVSLGCEEFKRSALAEVISSSGRPVDVLVIQEQGGTRSTIEKGFTIVDDLRAEVEKGGRTPFTAADLMIGTECGGSDGTSALTANPAIGLAFDGICAAGGTAMFEETCELFGCEAHMTDRAVTPELAQAIDAAMAKAHQYHTDLGYSSFGGGNITGGLTTIEEKSLGAYAKSGSAPIVGMLKPAVRPSGPGLYLMDTVNDGGLRFGIPNINDNATVIEMVASGCHMVLFSTGRGSVVGSAIAPIVKICANPRTFRNLSEDMDVDAGKVLEQRATLDDVALEILETVRRTAEGVPTKSEGLGHQEFILTYKTFEPLGPGCLPI